MRIGFDAKRAVQNFTGLGNYSRFIIDALSKAFPLNDYYLYSPKSPGNQSPVNLTDNIFFKVPPANMAKGYWRSRGILEDLRQHNIDVYHGLSNELPFGINKTGIKSVVTIHDLIFLRFPQYYPWFDRQIYKLKFRYACQNSDRIIAVSEQTKKDIVSFWNIPPAKIEVIYQDCNELFQKQYSPSEKAAIRNKYALPEKFLLNVGTIEDRKNLMLIGQSLKELPENVSLVVVGKATAYAARVTAYLEANNLSSRVKFLKEVAYADLPLIYQSAHLFIYPSRFEGFGIPIVEALHSGVPVIAATGSCLEEAGGPGSVYVNPDDPSQLAREISKLWDDEGRRAEMAETGRNHVQQFSNDKIAARLAALYHNVLNDEKRDQ